MELHSPTSSPSEDLPCSPQNRAMCNGDGLCSEWAERNIVVALECYTLPSVSEMGCAFAKSMSLANKKLCRAAFIRALGVFSGIPGQGPVEMVGELLQGSDSEGIDRWSIIQERGKTRWKGNSKQRETTG